MIIHPKIRGFICTTAHPVGCAKHVQNQIDYIKSKGPVSGGPKKALIIGASTGYGLSSRIVAAFGGSKAATVGVFFEKPFDGKKTATAGWYNSAAFEQKAMAAGLYAKSINGDAFSNEIKQQAVDMIEKDLGGIDLLVYSLASPRRVDPKTGTINKSVLKPIGRSYSNNSIDMSADRLETVTLEAATQEEIDQTVSVMGGEDWEMWVDILEKNNLLLDGFKTVAYSYIGPELTRPIYRNGTIGRAKDHLEATSKKLDARLKKVKGQALISVNKALVTQSSSAIPFIPLYFILLSKVMKAQNVEEGCIEQIYRLFSSVLYGKSKDLIDANGFIRMDNHEMREDIQKLVESNWSKVNETTIKDLADLDGYHKNFLTLFGFGLEGVNYDADVDPDVPLPSNTIKGTVSPFLQ